MTSAKGDREKQSIERVANSGNAEQCYTDNALRPELDTSLVKKYLPGRRKISNEFSLRVREQIYRIFLIRLPNGEVICTRTYVILKDYTGEERSEDGHTCELAFAAYRVRRGTRGTVTKKPTLPQGTRTTIFET